MHNFKNSLSLAVTGAAVVFAIAGCSILSNQPAPTPPPTAGPTSSADVSTETATPAPTPQPVKSVVLIARIGEPKDWTAAGLTWKGVQTAAPKIGATPTLVEPASNADFAKDLDQAAGAEGTVVVTVGADADAAVQAAAKAHPAAQFLEMDVAVADAAPANVHGIVFDEAEAGYLAGYVSAAFAASGRIGLVADSQADPRSANYAAGLTAGATQFGSGATVSVAYAGGPDAPDKGRTAAAGLVKAGNKVIVALPNLSGVGAMRQACAAKARIVGVDTDAAQLVPDVQKCVIVSVLKRFDAAVSAAIASIAAGSTLPRLSIDDVASGGVALGDFHADLPAGFQAGLDAVMVTLSQRPTPEAGAGTEPSPSPSPSPSA
jgi:basic membrane protein A